MKSTLILITTIISLSLASCGHKTLKTKEDAKDFLESNKFHDNDANISGQSGGKLKSNFSLSFSNGNVQIDNESFSYTISEKMDGRPGYQYFNGYMIEFCGSKRYAYGGCIKCYLSSGLKSNGDKEEDGSSLFIKGDYIDAYFSYTSKTAIIKK